MNFIEIKIEIPSKETEKATAIAHMITSDGIYIEDYNQMEKDIIEIAHIDLIDENLKNKPRDISVLHIYFNQSLNIEKSIEFLKNKLKEQDISYKITTIKAKPTDWKNKWKEFYHPIRVGKNIVICPKWENYKLNEGDIKVVLDPGMAFGTGMHETTKMCVELLEDLVTHDCKILDIGCGSGILSIASLMLGAKSIVGVDIDTLAVKVSNENAKLNDLSNDAYKFICGNLTENISGKFDIICANIVADVIINMLNNIKQFMHKNSFLICSGIIKSKKDDVIDKLRSENFIVKTIKEKNDWIAICCKIN